MNAGSTLFLADSFRIKAIVYRYTALLLVLCATIQLCAIDVSITNLCSTLLLLSTALISLRYLKSVPVLLFPNSLIILNGFVAGLCVVPLAFRTLEGKSLVEGLHEPLFTFGSISLFVIATLISHFIYVKSPLLLGIRKICSRSLAPFLTISPDTRQAAIIAVIGFSIPALSTGVSNVALSKILLALYPLTYLPFALICFKYLKSKLKIAKIPPKSLQILALIFFGMLVYKGFLSNSRSDFFYPLIIVFGTAMYMLFGFGKVLRLKILLPAILLFFFLAPVVTNISNSILLARAYRQSLSPMELASLTIDNFFNPIQGYSVYDSSNLWWNERYYNSEFLNRFSSIKNIDNLLYISNNLDPSAISDYRSFQLVRLISVLPHPLPSIFGVTAIQKKEANRFSPADYMFGFISDSTESRRLSGSFIPDSYMLFGLFSPLVYAIILLLLFPISDLFTISLDNAHNLLLPSCLGLLLMPDNLMLFSNGSLAELSVGYIRSVLEISMAFHIVSRLAKAKV